MIIGIICLNYSDLHIVEQQARGRSLEYLGSVVAGRTVDTKDGEKVSKNKFNLKIYFINIIFWMKKSNLKSNLFKKASIDLLL